MWQPPHFAHIYSLQMQYAFFGVTGVYAFLDGLLSLLLKLKGLANPTELACTKWTAERRKIPTAKLQTKQQLLR